MKKFLLVLLLSASPLWAATQDLRMTAGWDDNSDNELGFKIEAKVGAGAYSIIGTVGVDVRSFALDILGDPGGVTYCVRAIAYNTAGDAAPSPEKCDTSKVIQVVTIPASASGTTILLEVLKIDPNGVAGTKPTVRPSAVQPKSKAPTKAPTKAK